MRLDLSYEGTVRVTLSRRNLLTLLAELELPDAARVVVMRGAYLEGRLLEEIVLAVVAEHDEDHYADRGPPGTMAPATEAVLSEAPGLVDERSVDPTRSDPLSRSDKPWPFPLAGDARTSDPER